MEFKDYYRIMEVERDASQDEIKRAYRKLARKYHPDVSKATDAEDRFKELGEAYAVLKDLEKRAAYDQLGHDWKAGQEFRAPPDWNGGFAFSGNGADDAGATAFSEFFESLYGRGASRDARGGTSFQARGEDRHAKVLIDLEDAYAGATRTITVHTPGTDARGHATNRAHKLQVAIPRGVHAGQHIRLTGQGAPGFGGGKPGDLYLEVGFHDHPLFRVERRDVYLDLPLAPWEAALGATVTVPTPGGKVELKIPAGSMAGSRLRLKGRGIPGSTPGDFYVVLPVVLPPADDEPGRAFYEAMAKQFGGFDPRAGLGA